MTSNIKADPSSIIRAHVATYVDARTGKQRWQDHLVLEGLPVALGIVCFRIDLELTDAASAGLLTVSGLMSAFLFGVMLQASQRAMDWADSTPLPGPSTSAHATFLRELAANAGYSGLACIVAAAAFVAASLTKGLALQIATALGLALALHMGLVVFMVMKRVFALTEERLNRARTGADLPGSRRAS